jgi:biopolymer transport protein ExbD
MTGIYRKMSPAQAEEALSKKRDIEGRNLLEITLDKNNQIVYGEQTLTFPELRNMVKTFIANPNNVDFLPQKEEMDISGIGIYQVTSKHNISLKISREANYQAYLSVLNELAGAYNELRNETAQSVFQKSFDRLKPEQKESIREIYPQHISEKELETETKGGVQ